MFNFPWWRSKPQPGQAVVTQEVPPQEDLSESLKGKNFIVVVRQIGDDSRLTLLESCIMEQLLACGATITPASPEQATDLIDKGQTKLATGQLALIAKEKKRTIQRECDGYENRFECTVDLRIIDEHGCIILATTASKNQMRSTVYDFDKTQQCVAETVGKFIATKLKTPKTT